MRKTEHNAFDAQVPLVSVCIPAYKHGMYVQETLRSILAQDWPRMELVLVDDGSPDDTFARACELKPQFEGRFERVVLETKGNEGTCATFNRLRSLAHGEFFLLVASDDCLMPGAVRALAAPLLADPAVGVSVGVNEIMDGNGRKCFWDAGRGIVYDAKDAAYTTFNDEIASYSGIGSASPRFGAYSELVKFNHVPNGWMVRKRDLDRIPQFTRDAPMEDYWMHLQLSKITRYASVPEHTFRYRWHAANTVKQERRMRWYEYLTLKWEESYVFSPAGKPWREAFCAARHRTDVKPILGRLAYREKTWNLEECTRKLHIFGIGLTYKHTVLRPEPPQDEPCGQAVRNTERGA